MPELKDFENVKASAIRKGDIVVIPGAETDTAPITKIDVKTKYVWLTGEDGTRGRVGRDDRVTVRRMVQTKAEFEAEYRERTMRFLEASLVGYKREFEDAKKEFIDSINTAYGADAWKMERFAHAQETHRIWADIDVTWQKLQDREDNDKTLRDVVQYKINDIMEELSRARFLSRSTSAWHNIVEDTKMTAYQSFLKSISGYHTDIVPSINVDRLF